MEKTSRLGLMLVADGCATLRHAVTHSLTGFFERVEECGSSRLFLEKVTAVEPDLIVVGNDFDECKTDVLLRHIESIHGKKLLERVIVLGERSEISSRYHEILLGIYPLPLVKKEFREFVTSTVFTRAGRQVPGLNVLLVEDCAVNRMLTGMILQDMGHVCTCAGDGASALDKFRECCYDLVLMDIELPDTDGYCLANQIKQYAPDNSATPIIAFSAHKKQECPDSRYFADWIEKPAGKTELQRALAQLFSTQC